MSIWSQEIEEELAILLKDWLKQHGRTQADLRKSLGAVSSRMSSLLEVLKRDHLQGGLPRVAERLCAVENNWVQPESKSNQEEKESDPFGQLDFLLQEIRKDCTD